MAVFDLYSKRKKRELGEGSDVFVYDAIPKGLRAQVVHIWHDVIGDPSPYDFATQESYYEIVRVLRREYSVFELVPERIDRTDKSTALAELTTWFLTETETDKVLDAIELTFRTIKEAYKDASDQDAASEAVEELNTRFREHGVGYQVLDGQIVRVDSRLIHKEVVVPALAVLRDAEYANAQSEFLSAYEHFRHSKKQEALVDCYKCFESTMKVICTKRGWPFDPRAAAKDLVNVCLSNGLIPAYWQTHFNGLRSVLESAISTPRNRQAGHGAGACN